MENIALFIDQVKKIDYIDDFISRLSYVNTQSFKKKNYLLTLT